MNDLIISIIESIYLIYMFLFFKTTINFDKLTFRPRMDFNKKSWFYHSNSNDYGLKICLFGQIIIFVFIAILLLRHFITIPKYIMIIAIITGLLLSFINLNSLVYISPVIIYEVYKLLNIHKKMEN